MFPLHLEFEPFPALISKLSVSFQVVLHVICVGAYTVVVCACLFSRGAQVQNSFPLVCRHENVRILQIAYVQSFNIYNANTYIFVQNIRDFRSPQRLLLSGTKGATYICDLPGRVSELHGSGQPALGMGRGTT